jgi:hypothetical protein
MFSSLTFGPMLLVSFAREKGVLLMTKPHSNGGWTRGLSFTWLGGHPGAVLLDSSLLASRKEEQCETWFFSVSSALSFTASFGLVYLEAWDFVKLVKQWSFRKLENTFLAIPTFLRLILQIVLMFLKRM